MPHSRLVTVAALLLIQAVCCSRASHAQTPKRSAPCPPNPTSTDEVPTENHDPTLKMTGAAQPRVIVDSVEIEGATTLPPSLREQFVADATGHSLDHVRDVAEVSVRAALQDNGYFKAVETLEWRYASGDPSYQHVDVTIHVDEGLQYFLGDVEFRNSDPDKPLAFSPQELRQQLPLQEGDVFNAGKLRNSFDDMKRLYDSQGYIDFTVEPRFNIDDARRRISLILILDQQKQFHIGNIEVLGLDSETESALRSKLHRGDVVDPDLIRRFIAENKYALPHDASITDLAIKRTVKTGIADLVFDFSGCASTAN